MTRTQIQHNTHTQPYAVRAVCLSGLQLQRRSGDDSRLMVVQQLRAPSVVRSSSGRRQLRLLADADADAIQSTQSMVRVRLGAAGASMAGCELVSESAHCTAASSLAKHEGPASQRPGANAAGFALGVKAMLRGFIAYSTYPQC